MKKKHLIIIVSLALLLLVNFTSFAKAESTKKANINTSDIASTIENFVLENKDTTAGMSVAIFSEKETLYRNYFGYSDIENQILVDENTVMEWGSVSKLLVWVSVMQLVEQGKIDLNKDINNYLDEGFLRNRTFDEPLTMLNLMNHDAGFEETLIGMATADEKRIISLKDYLLTYQPKQIYKPGVVCAYSNWSTTLAAYVVEFVSGMDYAAYVRKNIFEPLKMNDTALKSDLSDNKSVQERRMALKTYQGLKEIVPNMNYIIMYPAGACTSTIEDMQKFAQALLSNDCILFNDSNTYKDLFTPSLYVLNTDIPRNYHGFWVEDSFAIPLIGHGGNTVGCTSHLLLDLENGIGMVIQTNQAGEGIYNYYLPQLIFGSYPGAKSDYVGLVRSPRAIFNGPLKLYSLFTVLGIELEDFNAYTITRNEKLNMDIIAAPYGDYLMIKLTDILPDLIVLGLYLLSIVYCLFNIIRHLIIFIIRKIKKNNTNKLPAFYPLSILLIIFPAIALFLIFISLMTSRQWLLFTYRSVFFLIGLSALIMLSIIIYSFKHYQQGKLTYLKTWDFYGILICLFITIINIVYWHWGFFWML